MDKKLPIRLEYHGGTCVKKGLAKDGMNWHPRFGYHDKKVNIECINNLFTKKTKNIVFFGGSVMNNMETPNYLTSIEYYAFKDYMNQFRSINFAISGSRLSNELSKFVEYIPKIKNIDLIIFLDGINELHPLKYGGKPDEDYYWTAGVKLRVHKPLYFLFDLIIDRSKLIEIVAIDIFNYKSSRIGRNITVNIESIEKSIEDYSYRKKVLNMLCDSLNLKCIFAIHPVFNSTEGLNSKNDALIESYINKHFPNNKFYVEKGYELLRKENGVIDLSKIYKNKENIFFDQAHTNKIGSEIMGKKLFEIISAQLK